MPHSPKSTNSSNARTNFIDSSDSSLSDPSHHNSSSSDPSHHDSSPSNPSHINHDPSPDSDEDDSYWLFTLPNWSSDPYLVDMSKELKFSLVKSFISKQTFQLLYSSLHQCNAELQNKKTDILIKQSLQIWVYSHMASLPSVVWLWLEMVKGNHSMIKSYISDRVPLSSLREEGCLRM